MRMIRNFNFNLTVVLLAMFAFCGSVYATTDIEVYSSSKPTGGVTVASLDAAGTIVDEQLVLVGQKIIGVQKGQPVPQPVALSAQEMKKGLSKIRELKETGISDQVNAKLDDLKRRITS